MTDGPPRAASLTSDAIVDEVRAALASPEAPAQRSNVVVGVSGGLDSTVLLHLLCFPLRGLLRPVAVHLDHAWRAESASDAAWVRGLGRAWGVPVRAERAGTAPTSEADARRARYALFEKVASETGASAILTAHHADDQAETVLFRVLRGTGLRGLGGIRTSREGRIFRPLLGVWRDAIEAYARGAGLRWRDDSTNRDPAFARNVVRHTLLPEAERVAPGARRALVRLSRIAAAEEEAWDELAQALLPGIAVARSEEETTFDRAAWALWPKAVRARLLRVLVRPFGLALDESTTERALRFASEAGSGATLELGTGVELRCAFDRLVLRRAVAPEPDRELRITGPGVGSGSVRVGGRRLDVWWTSRADATDPAGLDHGGSDCVRLAVACYPVVVRGRAAGDRIRLEGGTKTLKKLLVERRVPAHRRGALPIVVDGRGAILWVPGVAHSVEAAHVGPADVLGVRIGR